MAQRRSDEAPAHAEERSKLGPAVVSRVAGPQTFRLRMEFDCRYLAQGPNTKYFRPLLPEAHLNRFLRPEGPSTKYLRLLLPEAYLNRFSRPEGPSTKYLRLLLPEAHLNRFLRPEGPNTKHLRLLLPEAYLNRFLRPETSNIGYLDPHAWLTLASFCHLLPTVSRDVPPVDLQHGRLWNKIIRFTVLLLMGLN